MRSQTFTFPMFSSLLVLMQGSPVHATEAKLFPNWTFYDWFSFFVSISGDYAIVGACMDDDQGTSSGSAYAFLRSGSTWTETEKQMASDGAEGDEFGRSVKEDHELRGRSRLLITFSGKKIGVRLLGLGSYFHHLRK